MVFLGIVMVFVKMDVFNLIWPYFIEVSLVFLTKSDYYGVMYLSSVKCTLVSTFVYRRSPLQKPKHIVCGGVFTYVCI